MYAQDSIDLLTRSGINFKRHEDHGVDVSHFGELLTSSGIVLDDRIKWISFHSGYDIGYLLKLLTCKPLPAQEDEFFELIHTYFPCIYDIKYLMKSCKSLKGGLNELASDLEVPFSLLPSLIGSSSCSSRLWFCIMHLRYVRPIAHLRSSSLVRAEGGAHRASASGG
jgi:hypothetical protein